MKWEVNLGVRQPQATDIAAARLFTVESKSVAMALEKAVQLARIGGWETTGVHSCNPIQGGRYEPRLMLSRFA